MTHIQLGYNAETKAVGIRPAPEEGKGRYLLRAQKNSASRLIDGKRFFAHQGVTLEKVRRYDVEEFGGGIIGFHLTEASEPEAAGESEAANVPEASEAKVPDAAEADEPNTAKKAANSVGSRRGARAAA